MKNASAPGTKNAILLVCATGNEMQAALRLLPENGGCAHADHADLCALFSGPKPAPVRISPGGALYTLVCGVGPVAAALSLGAFLAGNPAVRSSLRCVVNMGIAGSCDPAQAPVGSAVLVTEEVLPDYAIRQDDGTLTVLNFPQGTLGAAPAGTRLPLAPRAALGNPGLSRHSACDAVPLIEGVSITSASVSGTPATAARAAAAAGGLIENMEGFSLALACAAAGLPFVELRTVSNPAGLRPPHGWDIPAAFETLGKVGREFFL